MQFELTRKQLMIQKNVREFMRKEILPVAALSALYMDIKENNGHERQKQKHQLGLGAGQLAGYLRLTKPIDLFPGLS